MPPTLSRTIRKSALFLGRKDYFFVGVFRTRAPFGQVRAFHTLRGHKSKSISRLLVASSGDYAVLNWHSELGVSLGGRFNPAGSVDRRTSVPVPFSLRMERSRRRTTGQNGARMRGTDNALFAEPRSSSRNKRAPRIQPAVKDAKGSFSAKFHPRGCGNAVFSVPEENLSIAPRERRGAAAARRHRTRRRDETNHCNNEARWLLKKKDEKEKCSNVIWNLMRT